MRHILAAVFVAAAAGAAAGGVLAANPRYTTVDLGSQDDLDWVSLNDRGEVTGQIGFPLAQAAVRLPNGSIVRFPPFAPFERAEATATNNGGTTVGFAALRFTVGAAGASWQRDGALTVLGDRVVPQDVNDAGQIVGTRFVVDRNTAFLREGGVTRELAMSAPFGIAPLFVEAVAINVRGDTVGRGQDSFGIWPLIWAAGTTDGVRLPRYQSSFANAAVDVNGDGVVVGRLTFNSRQVAIKWVNGQIVRLPTLSGVDGRFGSADAINDKGDIVGWAEELVATDVGQVATLWTEEGIIDLNTLVDLPGTLVLTKALDINDRGQILAQAEDPATYSGGNCCGERLFLLTAEECEPIPEDELASGDAGDGLPDADGDAIPDCWEEDGIPVETEDGDLLFYELPGADPERRDLYVEVDHMAGFAPEPGALEDVVAAFATAPVGNPDGSAGITLHVEVDDEVPYVPGVGFAQGSPGPGALDDFWDLKSGGPLPCDGFFGSGSEREDDLCTAKLGAKRLVYRYAIFGDTHTSADNDASGIAECGTLMTEGCAGAPGNDLLVTIGSRWEESELAEMGGRRAMEAGAFMHEFGHTLALDHGGGDTVNCKPNYVSSMNYAYALVPTETTAVRLLDYSRSVSTLDEARLDEAAGVGGPAAVVFGWMGLWRAAAGGAVDWNRDGTIGTASANVNWIQLVDACRQPVGLPPSKVDGNGIALRTLNFRSSEYDDSSVPVPAAFEAIVCRPAPGNSFDCESVVPLRVEIDYGVVFLTLPVTVAPADWVRARYRVPDENPLLVVFDDDGSVQPEDNNTEWNLENVTGRRELLRGFDDWANLRYGVRDGQGFADLAGRAAHPESELTFTELRAVAQDLLAQLDREPPAVRAAALPAANTSGWNRETVTVILTASDDGSGVREIVYDLGGPQVTVPDEEARVVVSAEGITTLTYLALDRRGNASAPQTLVVRIDRTAPTLSCRATPGRLWPPNHKLVDVSTVVTVADPLSGPAAFTLLSVASSEPDEGLGDGDTANDVRGWQAGIADVSGQLRAERSGNGSGRLYSLDYDARDVAGNVGRCTATVAVPRNG